VINVYLHPNGLTVDGHAEYAEYGQDIVCASVSVLTQIIGKAIWQETNANIQKSPGKLTLVINKETPESKVLFKTLKHGLREIASQYPDNVKIFGTLEKLS
jgi:uncharacterized protein YsxB (DUF464 family)